MNTLKTYFKVAWYCKTPLVFLLDRRYKPISKDILHFFYRKMPDLDYIPELRDCDNFAFIYKGIADRQTNVVGMVVGKSPSGLHCWNIALTDEGIHQLEPQTGQLFKKRKGYRPLIVIM